MEGQDIGRVHEKVRPEIFPLRIAGEFGEIFGKFRFGRAPGEVGVGLGEPQLGERLHQLRARKRFREKD